MKQNNTATATSLNLNTFEMKMIRLSDIDAHPLQPTVRSSERAIRELKEMVMRSNTIHPPAIVHGTNGRRYILLDGHRRVAVAQSLGHTELNCAVYRRETDVEIRDLYIQLNSGTRPVRGANFLTFYAKGGNTKKERQALLHSPSFKNYRNHIEGFIDVFGEERAVEIGLEEKVSPDSAEHVKVFTRLAAEFEGKIKGGIPGRSEIGEWMLRHDAIRWLRQRNEDRESGALFRSVKLIASLVRKDINPKTHDAKMKRQALTRKGRTKDAGDEE